MTTTSPLNEASLTELQTSMARLRDTVGRRVVGQDRVIEQLLVCLLGGGHGLFVGVPGLAKTLLVRSVAESLGLSFSRIQFTPDLMPADVLGSEVLEEDRDSGQRSFRFLQGPVFAQLLLADEINRTPPKTQSALLQAMQEKTVTVGGKDHGLPQPFHVFATQNPIEQEGTYPLPEAQLDRFMMQIRVAYPSAEEELAIAQLSHRELMSPRRSSQLMSWSPFKPSSKVLQWTKTWSDKPLVWCAVAERDRKHLTGSGNTFDGVPGLEQVSFYFKRVVHGHCCTVERLPIGTIYGP